jgi:peptidoglycan hydrolase-like protein with peptidoglycan-binding domain
MTTTLTIQERLIALGFYVGPKGADGEYGPGTIGGILAAISELERLMDNCLSLRRRPRRPPAPPAARPSPTGRATSSPPTRTASGYGPSV